LYRQKRLQIDIARTALGSCKKRITSSECCANIADVWSPYLEKPRHGRMSESEISNTRGKSLAHAEEVKDEGQLQVCNTSAVSTKTLVIQCSLQLWLILPWTGWRFDCPANEAARAVVSFIALSLEVQDSHEEVRCVIGSGGGKRVCNIIQDVLRSEPGSNV
jgi:hypothetical protein